MERAAGVSLWCIYPGYVKENKQVIGPVLYLY